MLRHIFVTSMCSIYTRTWGATSREVNMNETLSILVKIECTNRLRADKVRGMLATIPSESFVFLPAA
jgi:hypothetical protein